MRISCQDLHSPAKVKIDDVTAQFKDGVLTVTMPKLEKKETFNVKID
ncbi:Hsp20 family protein [uncultured Methanobacterium sp.]